MVGGESARVCIALTGARKWCGAVPFRPQLKRALDKSSMFLIRSWVWVTVRQAVYGAMPSSIHCLNFAICALGQGSSHGMLPSSSRE